MEVPGKFEITTHVDVFQVSRESLRTCWYFPNPTG